MEVKTKITIIFLTILLIILTPKMNDAVNYSRSTPGIGGECLLWLLPYFIYGLYDTFFK